MMRQRPERTRTETFKSQGFSLLTLEMFPRLRYSQTGAQTGLVLLSTEQMVRLSLHRGGFWEMLSDRDKHDVHSSTYQLFYHETKPRLTDSLWGRSPGVSTPCEVECWTVWSRCSHDDARSFALALVSAPAPDWT